MKAEPGASAYEGGLLLNGITKLQFRLIVRARLPLYKQQLAIYRAFKRQDKVNSVKDAFLGKLIPDGISTWLEAQALRSLCFKGQEISCFRRTFCLLFFHVIFLCDYFLRWIFFLLNVFFFLWRSKFRIYRTKILKIICVPDSTVCSWRLRYSLLYCIIYITLRIFLSAIKQSINVL